MNKKLSLNIVTICRLLLVNLAHLAVVCSYRYCIKLLLPCPFESVTFSTLRTVKAWLQTTTSHEDGDSVEAVALIEEPLRVRSEAYTGPTAVWL